MPRYLLYLKSNPGAWDKLSDEARTTILFDYRRWSDDLKRRGKLLDGDPVEEQVHHIAPLETDDRGTGRPHREILGDLVLTAVFRIAADDWDEAIRIAESCPARKHGEHVIIQPLAGD